MTTQSNSIIQLQNINFAYEGKNVLSQINFSLSTHQFIGIIGPNGSGKTTLLKIISGILKPDQGNVLLNNRNLLSIPRKKIAQKIAVVPQDSYVSYNYQVKEVVFMGRIPYINQWKGETIEDYRISLQAMQKTDSACHAEKGIQQISGGEMQRVFLARALAQSPEILLLDEFASHLDLNYKYEMIKILRETLQDKIKCIVAVFHDLNLASISSDQLILLNQGKIEKMGTPKEVINQHTIEKVYQAKPYIIKHPQTSLPQLIM